MAHKYLEKWPEAKHVEVVASYLVLGKATLVEAVTGVPAGTILQWKTQPWWQELVDQIQTEEDQELDTKLSSRINKVLALVEDRLENGDWILDSKTGTIIRKPVSLKDSWKTGKEMIDVRQMMRDRPKDRVDKEAVSDILKNLAVEFASMARKKVKENAGLQVGISELSEPTDPKEASSEAEQSPANA